MKRNLVLFGAVAVAASAVVCGRAQIPVPPPAPAVVMRSPAELDQMLGPIALYLEFDRVAPRPSASSELVVPASGRAGALGSAHGDGVARAQPS